MGTKLSGLTATTEFHNTDIFHLRTTGGVDKKITGINLIRDFETILIKSASYTILDVDRNPLILMTTGASDRIVTLPTLADNEGKRIKLIKVDSGIGKVTLDGEGAETINGKLSISLITQWNYIEIIGTSSNWIIIDQSSIQIIVAKSNDYTILDTDGISVIKMTVGVPGRTVTLPTAIDNLNREITLIKTDSGQYAATLKGEGTETINNTSAWAITKQWGKVKVKSDGSNWIVLAQSGCIYETWDNNTHTLAASWTSKYSLVGITSGIYLIEYGFMARAAANVLTYGTIATSASVEDDTKYTLINYVGAGGTTDMNFLTKRFLREFAATSTLYFNGKGLGGHVRNDLGDGYIRATRIG